ncbi:MAG: efflux RND transporter permease subunit [Christensenellaceae bacterium]|jgi:HAE1 family hydrophobic/amphiphilic exporter-1|nr:efflux RND transporter permease subunit [Christensenellaceae bacterium]
MLGRVSVKKPYLVIVMIIIIMIMGVISYTQMSVDFLPNMNFPYLVAITISPGLAPLEIESQVTDYIEDAVQGIQNIETITSMSMEHASIVIMQFDSDANLDTAVLDLQTALANVKDSLPDDTMDSMITKINPTMLPIMTLTISENGKSIGDSSKYLSTIYDELRHVNGVSSVDENGLVENQALVVLSEERLKNSIFKQLSEYYENINLDSDDLVDSATDDNENLEAIADALAEMIMPMLDSETVGLAIYAQNLEVPAGSITEGISSYLVKVGDKIASADELELLPIMTLDFQKLFEGSEQLIEALGQLRIYQSMIDSLKNFADEDGLYQRAVNQFLNAFDESTKGDDGLFVYQYIDGKIVYIIDPNLIKNLRRLAENGQENSSIDLSTISNATWTSIAIALGITSNDLFDYLGQIPFFTLEVDGNGKPTTLTLDSTMKSILRMADSLADDLETIVVTREELDSARNSILDLKGFGESIANVASELEEYLNNGDIFEPVYTNGDEEIVSYYQLKADYISKLKDLPALELTIGGLAEVYHLNTASKILNLVNGSAGVMISINKQPDYSTVDVSNAVKEFLEAEKKANPDFEYLILSDQGESVIMMINSLVQNILIGMGLAIIILFIFLKDLRATLIVAMSMIISIITAFVLMYFAGISLNILSLSGLCLGVGMLVDNSIVVLENIYKLRAEGKSVYRACVQGSKEMGGAITASTITTIIVFVPLIFLKGITQQLIIDIALTLAFSLIASLVVALTLVPMASSYLLKKPAKKESKWFERFKNFYAKVLDRILRYRLVISFAEKNAEVGSSKINANWIINEPSKKKKKTDNSETPVKKRPKGLSINFKVIALVVAIILLIGSGAGLLSMKRIFFPATDAGAFTLSVSVDRNKLPDNLTYEENVKKIIDYIYSEAKKLNDVESVGVELSSGMVMMGVSIGAGDITAYVTLKENTKSSSEDVAKTLKETCSQMSWLSSDAYTVSYNADSGVLGSMGDLLSGNTVSIVFTGDDLDTMRDNAIILADLIDEANIPGVISVNNGVSDAEQEYHIVLDKEKAAAKGLTIGQVYQMLAADFEMPSSSTTVNYPKTDDDSPEGLYDVIVYRDVYNIQRWYVLNANINGILIGTQKIFISRDSNTGNDTYYISSEGVEYPVLYDESTQSFKYDSQYTNNTTIFTSPDANLITYYDIERKVPIDITTYEITTTVSLGDELGSYTMTFPLFEICSDETFVKDNYGKVLYRVLEYEKDVDGSDKLDENGERIPAVYELDERNGLPIPLSIKREPGYTTIIHNDGIAQLTVTAKVDIEKYNITNVSAQVEKVMNAFRSTLPEGVMVDFEGEEQMIIDVYQTLLIVLGVGIILIYLVMVAQFQSLKLPFIIMFTIPLAFTGSVFALIITGFPISVVAMVGLIILMGVVVNNGIVFIDNVRRLINSGYDKIDALVKTARDRLRPILMTALTTIIALFGMALDGSASGAMMQPMGIATLGGLFYATFLTLFIVPIMFDLLDKGKKSRFVEEDKDIEFADDTDVAENNTTNVLAAIPTPVLVDNVSGVIEFTSIDLTKPSENISVDNDTNINLDSNNDINPTKIDISSDSELTNQIPHIEDVKTSDENSADSGLSDEKITTTDDDVK